MIFGAKDIDSKHLISTNSFAEIVGLKNGYDVIDRFDSDMPCEGTAQFANNYIEEDKSLINNGDINKTINTLNVHNYADGLKIRIFQKSLLKDIDKNSVIGIIYCAHEINPKHFFSIIPNYIFEFNCSDKKSIDFKKHSLSDYEHEICFLLLLNWSFNQISSFINKYNHNKNNVTADAIIKSKNRICEKIGIQSTRLSDLKSVLIDIGVHKKVPDKLLTELIGSNLY
jgi:hypothetical protein